MVAELIDTVVSLTTLIEEESGRLAFPGPALDLRELVAAKSRLVVALDLEVSRLARERPNWVDEMDPAARSRFAASVTALQDAAVVNAGILERQIDLSTEMMAAIVTEVGRLAGARNATYGASGCLFASDFGTPISINTRI